MSNENPDAKTKIPDESCTSVNIIDGTFTERTALGFGYPFSAFLTMFRKPMLLTIAIIPVIFTACILVILLAALFTWGDQITNRIWLRPDEWYWLLLWYPLHLILLTVIFGLGAVSLPGIISSPFNKVLSRRSERVFLGEKIDKQGLKKFFSGIPSALMDQIRKILFLLIIHLFLLILLIIPFVGQFFYPFAAWLWTVIWLAAENLDFSFSRHRYNFFDNPRTVKRNFALCFGFGLAVFLLLLIPFLNFFFIPVAVVAGTRLFVDLRKADVIGKNK